LAKLTRVELAVGQTASAAVTDTTLTIHVAREYRERPDAGAWRVQLERVL